MARSNGGGLASRRPFTILGILLALLVMGAFVLVAINASAGQITPTESVVIATKDLAPRIAIDPADLQLKSIPIGGYPDEILFHRASDVAGMVPLVTIKSGQAITSNLIAKPGTELRSQAEFLQIPSGFVAVTLPTSEQQGVAGYIEPGDYIAVLATVDVGAKIATATVFTNVYVLRVGTPGSQAQGAAQVASSLTVMVTECQAQFLTWFLAYASLKYTLESHVDYLPTANIQADPSCATVDAAKGQTVTLKTVQTVYPELFS